MRNYKNYMLGALTVAAGLGFTACSSDNEAIKPKDDMQGFYLNFSLVGTDATRSDQTGATTDPGKDYESTVKTGTLFLYQGNTVKFLKQITESDWKTGTGPLTSNSIPVSVNNVQAGVAYTVYFLANSYSFSDPIADTHTAESGTFVGPFATKNAFVMFNQNDASHNGAQYTVTFTDANKDKENPAKVVNGNKVAGDAIKIERIVARVDAPVSEATKVVEPIDGKSSESQEDAQKKVESVKYLGYAISNIPQKTNIMQQWSGLQLQIPTLTENNYYQNYASFGTATKLGETQFKSTNDSTYVFENIAANDSKTYTRMYFKYQVNLTADAKANADCTDGTFYRYDHKIYTSLEAIEKSIGGTSPFGQTVKYMKEDLLKISDGKITADENELAAFRSSFNIEVFPGGVCYYNTPITDEKTPTGYNSVLRNTIYKLVVKNVFNVGADVPNGDPDDLKPNYYIQVAVTVNPWILRTYDVNLE